MRYAVHICLHKSDLLEPITRLLIFSVPGLLQQMRLLLAVLLDIYIRNAACGIHPEGQRIAVVKVC